MMSPWARESQAVRWERMLTEDISHMSSLQIKERILNEWGRIHALLCDWRLSPLNLEVERHVSQNPPSSGPWGGESPKGASHFFMHKRQETFQKWLWFLCFLGSLTRSLAVITWGRNPLPYLGILSPICMGNRTDWKVQIKTPTHKNKENQIKEAAVLSRKTIENCLIRGISISLPISL